MRTMHATARTRAAAVAAAAALTLALAACSGGDPAGGDAATTIPAGHSSDGAPAGADAPPSPSGDPGAPAAPAAATDAGAAADAGRLAEVSHALLELPDVSGPTKEMAHRAIGVAERIGGLLGHADPAQSTLREEDLARVTGGEGVHADLGYLELLHAALPPLLDRLEASGAEGAGPVLDDGRALMADVDERLGA